MGFDTNYAVHLKIEAAITAKARELVGDVPSEFNLEPTRQLVRKVWEAGFIITKPGTPGSVSIRAAE